MIKIMTGVEIAEVINQICCNCSKLENCNAPCGLISREITGGDIGGYIMEIKGGDIDGMKAEIVKFGLDRRRY